MRGAGQGLTQSQYVLGDLYYLMGESSGNRIHVFVWWSIAASQGSEDALVKAAELEPKLEGSELEVVGSNPTPATNY